MVGGRGANAAWLRGGILRVSRHYVVVVDSRRPAVIAAQRGQRSHFLCAVPPKERDTDEVVAITAKIFRVRVDSAGL